VLVGIRSKSLLLYELLYDNSAGSVGTHRSEIFLIEGKKIILKAVTFLHCIQCYVYPDNYVGVHGERQEAERWSVVGGCYL